MPVLILAVLLGAVALWLLFKVVGTVIGLLLALLVAGLVGALADKLVPGRLPYGWAGAVAAGLLGAWLGTLVLGRMGPSLFGLPLLPAFVGAVVVAALVELVMKRTWRRV